MQPELESLLSSIGLPKILFSATLVFLALILARLCNALNTRFGKQFPQWRLLGEQVFTVVNFLIILLGFVIAAFSLFGFSKEVVLAVGGSLAVAIGFGLKDVAASVLAGFLIIFERPFQVGDRVRFGDTYGDVISVGLRATRVRTLDDSTVTIPNSKIINESVSSANSGALDMMAQIDFYIGPIARLELVERLVREAVVASRYAHLKKPIKIMFKDDFREMHYCTRIRIQAYVIETRYEKLFESDLNKKLRAAFQTYGVLRPDQLPNVARHPRNSESLSTANSNPSLC